MRFANQYFYSDSCITPEKFAASKALTDFYIPTSTSTGNDGITALASFEAKRYPFFGTQPHPEKNMYEWNFQSIPHTLEAIQV